MINLRNSIGIRNRDHRASRAVPLLTALLLLRHLSRAVQKALKILKSSISANGFRSSCSRIRWHSRLAQGWLITWKINGYSECAKNITFLAFRFCSICELRNIATKEFSLLFHTLSFMGKLWFYLLLWAWNFACYVKERIYTEAVWEQLAQGIICDLGSWSNRRIEKTTWWAAAQFELSTRFDHGDDVKTIMDDEYGINFTLNPWMKNAISEA
jgi:hypothetical protein